MVTLIQSCRDTGMLVQEYGMKKTVEISNELAQEVAEYVVAEGVTFRNVVERGLREVLRKDSQRKPFVLRDASVHGEGLQEGFRGKGWEALRDAVYEGRGS